MALLPHTDYFYDLTGVSAYILFNGEADLLKKVIDFLQENNIHCTGSAPSRYPARSGKQYQWFIRVTDANGAKPDPSTIHRLMRDFRDDSQAEQLSNLSAQIEELDKRLKMQVESNLELAEERERLKHTTQQREVEISQLWKELENYERIKREDDEFIAEISKEVDNLKQANEIVNQQLISVRAENEQLKQELSEAKESQEIARDTCDLARLMDDFKSLLTCLMPNIKFMRDSLDVMTNRLANPFPVLEVIGQIAAKKQKGERVRSVENWWEIHFNTGQHNTGRVYYRVRSNGESDSYDILISLKESQKQDFDYLRRC